MSATPAELLQRLEQAVRSFGPQRNGDGAGQGGDPLALALADVARHLGSPVSLVALTAGLPLVEGRLPLEHAEAAARRAGLDARLADITIDGLADAGLPLLAVLAGGGVDIVWALETGADGAPAAVMSAPGRADIKARVPLAELAGVWQGQALLLRPSHGGDGRGGEALSAAAKDWFLPAFKASRRVYSEAIAATVAINVLALAMPLFTMNVYDRVLPNAAVETLWALSIGVLLATAFDFLIKTLRGRFVDTAGRRADVVLANLIYGRLIGARLTGAPPSIGVRANTLREFETLRDFFNSATLTAFGDLPFLLLFIAMIAFVGGGLVAIPLLAIPLLLGIGWLTQRWLGRLSEASFRETAQKNAVAVETLAGLETIKAAGAESWAAGKWERAVADNIRTATEIRHLSNIGLHTVHAAQTIIQVTMIIVGFFMVAAGALTTGALIASTMLAGRALQPLGQMAMLLTRLHQARIAYRSLSEIVRAPQERADGAHLLSMIELTGAVTFEDVTFAYAKDAAPALAGVSIVIRAGERVGIVGGIGSGKSTVLKLLHAVYLPARGRVLVDGIPVHQIDPAVLRAQIGYALQSADLFHGSIRANIVLGDSAAGDERLMVAARTAGALEWVMRLPKGFETPLRERGSGLSSGQRQTVALARALVREPRILLLDEPTSDMDGRTEQTVIQRLRQHMAGRTLIVVTHRPAVLDLVDRLIVLDGGRVLLDGPKASVLESLKTMAAKAAAPATPAKSATGKTP